MSANVRADHAIASPSTQKRRSKKVGSAIQHRLNPGTVPASEQVLRSAMVAGLSCLLAKATAPPGSSTVPRRMGAGITAPIVDRQDRAMAAGASRNSPEAGRMLA